MNDMTSKFDKANITLLDTATIQYSVFGVLSGDELYASKFDKANITLLDTATIQYSVFGVLSGDELYDE